MALQIWVLSFATLVSLCVAVIALCHRKRHGGLLVGLLMGAVAAWNFFYILEAGAATVELKVLWSRFAYIGTLSTAPLFLQLSLEVTQRRHWWRGALPWLAWSIPVLTVLLAFTNDAHNLVWSGFSYFDASHRTLIYERGPWFWLMLAHTYALLIAATSLLILSAVRYRAANVHAIYRQQVALTLLSLVPPWTLSILYIMRVPFLGGREWTPAGFAITGLLVLWNIGKFQFIDLVPVARDRVVESIEDGVIVIDDRARIADVNPAAERLLGRTGLVGTSALDLVATWTGIPRAPGDGGQEISRAPAPQADAIVLPGLPPEGEVVAAAGVLEWRVTPLDIRRTPGQIILLQDVTERKKAEVALQSLNATLEFRVAERTAEILAEKRRSDAILRNISDSIIMTDGDLYILYANPAFEQLSGYDADAALGCPVSDILGDAVAALLIRAQMSGESCEDDTTLTHRDHRAIDVAMTVSPVKRCRGDISGYVCTLRDITQLKNLERARKGFIDNISHQLRTPVTNLRLYAHLMAQSDLTAQSRSHLDVMMGQTAWLQHLIEDMLEIASLDSGQAVRDWKAVSLATLLDHLAARYQPQAERAGLQFRAPTYGTTLPSVMGDPTRLIQAVSEIADNAIRFTPAGGEIVFAVTSGDGENERGWVTLSITDTGPGIPEAERPRIFDRFFRGAITEAGHLPGTGLGLSIAEAIVHAHGGQITLDTNTCGSTFTVRLPAAPATHTPKPTED